MGQGCARPDHAAVLSIQPKVHSTPLRPLTPDSFEFIRVIGSGSFSQVRLAKLKETEMPVAVKVMNKAHLIKSKQVTHVFAEKQILRLVDSPFVVTYIGTFQDATNLFCVMEYLSGGELFRLLCERDVLTRADATFYAAEVTMALCALHGIHCVYRDLKPENVLISSLGHTKLADLGLAKMLLRDERTFTTCGTPEYISPEVIEGMGYKESCDWWQLGILLYEMMSAQTPFASTSPYLLYSNILTMKVRFGEEFDDASRSLISQLLNKNPENRLKECEILRHEFFAGVNWRQVKELGLKPPFIPELADPFDSIYYDNPKKLREEEGCIEDCLQSAFDGY